MKFQAYFLIHNQQTFSVSSCTALEVEEELRAAIRAGHEKSKLLRIEFSSESRMALVREVGSLINLCIRGLEAEA